MKNLDSNEAFGPKIYVEDLKNQIFLAQIEEFKVKTRRFAPKKRLLASTMRKNAALNLELMF